MQKTKIGMLARWIACAPLLLAFGCASFVLTSEPLADIYENDEKIATTPYRFNLLSGERAFSLRHSGHVEEEVVVSSLDRKNLHFRLERVGRTRIDTLPRGAAVIRPADRTKLGVSPCGLRLSRRERVRIEKKGFEPVDLELVPNETYQLELKPTGGFKSVFYKEILFTSDSGKVEIHDRVADETLGTTPVRLAIEAGSEIEYRLAGHRPRTALISKRAPQRIHIEMDPITMVTISGTSGARVYRAGGIEPLGEVPFTIEVDSDILFELKKDGYYDSTIAVSPDSPEKLPVELKKIPYKTIVTTPPGAEIYRLGGIEKLGVSPYTTIVDGERVFEIKKKGFEPEVVGMGSSSPVQLSVPLTATFRSDTDAAALGTLDSPVTSTY